MAKDFGAGPELVKGARKMPRQKPGESKQDYATPKEFIDAVKKKFAVAHFAWDLAATNENAVDGCGATGWYFGPTHCIAEQRDALINNWARHRGDLWLNPPYAHIAPWAEKCAASAPYRLVQRDRRIFFLVPAAVGSNWHAQHVDGKARVYLLNGRISFDGKGPYPKDCYLAVYGMKPEYSVWRWRP